MQPLSAYLLVYHGSSDPRPQAAAQAIAHFFSERICHIDTELPLSIQNPKLTQNSKLKTQNSSSHRTPLISVAALEGDPLPLHQQICKLGQSLQLAASNHDIPEPGWLLVLPLFLLSGVHVMEDIPAEVAQAQTALGQGVDVKIMPHLGSHGGLYRLIAERLSALPVEASILLSHGSRRPGANQRIEALAERLGAIPAYWSVPPNLESRLQELMDLGFKKIAILPYFLFSGSTTDAIAQTCDRLSHQFPTLDIHLFPPLEAYPELADLLVDLAVEKSFKF
ncbi:sirohydrochlorin chelatase [Kovacikia minuta CCNUW1]|uniref:sirohydrochlorin chelatase n=1 Tax=Kovacikia minuta TaxID=2931930 RepID=UPI001CCE4E4E|nr:CbiX/SirB N-terminal domain-containing protein [Kovacikia minuta]UBF27412.1 sirohydrochlorin chelatase [Kovacikia minuta CCNUW1]